LAVSGAVGHAEADATGADAGGGAAGGEQGFVGAGGAKISVRMPLPLWAIGRRY